MTQDLTIYGSIFIKNGTLTLTGHNLTVYGNVYQEGGTVIAYRNCNFDIKGTYYQTSGTLDIKNISTVSVADNYYHYGASKIILDASVLNIHGNYQSGYIKDDGSYGDGGYIIASNESEINIGKNCYFYKLYSNQSFESGSMNINGTELFVGEYTLKCSTDFEINFTGSGNVNITGKGAIKNPKVSIQNAENRMITISCTVDFAKLGGGDMTIISKSAVIGIGELDSNIIIEGNVTIANNIHLKGYELTINGDVKHTDGTIKVYGDLLTINGNYTQSGGILDLKNYGTAAITGNYEQTGGNIGVNSSVLNVGGNFKSGYIKDDGSYGDGGYIIASNESEINIGKNCYFYKFYGNQSFESGSMNINGTELFVGEYTLKCLTDFEINFTGSGNVNIALKKAKISKPIVNIIDAKKRKININGSVEISQLKGGEMTITATDGSTISIDSVYDDLTVNGNCTLTVKNNNCATVTLNGAVLMQGNHQWDTGIVLEEPTCFQAGSRLYTCTKCGIEHTEETEALAHIPGADATCTEDQVCTVCGEILTAKLGHDYDSVVTAPTCTEDGYTTYTCVNCGDTYVADETAAIGHAYDAVVTAPTCTKQGYTTHTCACGDAYKTDYTDATGHDYKAVVTAPTCEKDGYTTYTCANCGDSYKDDYTDMLHHDFADGDRCIHCGEKLDCVHFCHTDVAWLKFIWKIFNFLYSLFGVNRYCECGMAHY